MDGNFQQKASDFVNKCKEHKGVIAFLIVVIVILLILLFVGMYNAQTKKIDPTKLLFWRRNKNMNYSTGAAMGNPGNYFGLQQTNAHPVAVLYKAIFNFRTQFEVGNQTPTAPLYMSLLEFKQRVNENPQAVPKLVDESVTDLMDFMNRNSDSLLSDQSYDYKYLRKKIINLHRLLEETMKSIGLLNVKADGSVDPNLEQMGNGMMTTLDTNLGDQITNYADSLDDPDIKDTVRLNLQNGGLSSYEVIESFDAKLARDPNVIGAKHMQSHAKWAYEHGRCGDSPFPHARRRFVLEDFPKSNWVRYRPDDQINHSMPASQVRDQPYVYNYYTKSYLK